MRNNKRVEEECLDDKSFLFGRVIKPLGNCFFEISYVDEKKIVHSKAIARVRSANCARIFINDIIAVLPDGDGIEIRGKLTRSSLHHLTKEGRLHKDLVGSAEQEEDNGFIIEEEVDIDQI